MLRAGGEAPGSVEPARLSLLDAGANSTVRAPPDARRPAAHGAIVAGITAWVLGAHALDPRHPYGDLARPPPIRDGLGRRGGLHGATGGLATLARSPADSPAAAGKPA